MSTWLDLEILVATALSLRDASPSMFRKRPSARAYCSPTTTTLLSVAPWEPSDVSTRSGYLGILPEE